MVSSFKAIGEEDSAKYYSSIYKSMFPNLELDKFDDVNKFQDKVKKRTWSKKDPISYKWALLVIFLMQKE